MFQFLQLRVAVRKCFAVSIDRLSNHLGVTAIVYLDDQLTPLSVSSLIGFSNGNILIYCSFIIMGIACQKAFFN